MRYGDNTAITELNDVPEVLGRHERRYRSRAVYHTTVRVPAALASWRNPAAYHKALHDYARSPPMTAWLTQITPDYRNRTVYRDLRDATRMHRLVMSLAPDGLGEEPRRQAGVLYRIEAAPNGTRVLVQTGTEPDLSKLPAEYRNAQARDLDPLLRWLREGAVVRYRLSANTCLRKAHSTKSETEKLV